MRSCLLFGIMVSCFGLVSADTIELFDGRQLNGTIAAFSDGNFLILPSGGTAKEALPVEDATAVIFDASTRGGSENRRLIHPREKEANIGVLLRAGYHKLVVVYAGKAPALQYATRAETLKRVPSSILYACQDAKHFRPSLGLDSEGYRLPDSPGNAQQGVTFWHYSSDAPIDIVKLNSSSLTFVASGRNDDVRSRWSESSRSLGIFTMLVNFEQDGEYELSLAGNPNAALYLGATPAEFLTIMRRTIENAPAATWQVELAVGGRIDGQIEAWTDSVIHLQTLNDQLPVLRIPTEHIVRVARGSERSGNDATKIEQDLVIASVTNDRNTRVLGRVNGIENGKLSITYKNADRTISLDKVVEVVLGGAKFATPRICYQQVQLSAVCSFPSTLTSVSNTGVVATTAWGQEISIPHDGANSLRLAIRNGRVQFLSDIEPVKVEETPFFDRMMRWKTNQSLTGSTLAIGKTEYTHGIAMHSRTELTYDLAGNYDRFMAVVGIAPEVVNLGDAAIQVIGDNQVLYEHARLVGEEAIEIDLSVAGVQRLTLRTDFGKGQDVGDRVHWANARIVRQSSE